LRDEAVKAVGRGAGSSPAAGAASGAKSPKRRSSRELALADELERSLGTRQAGRFKERLVTANAAFEREHYLEVRKLLAPVIVEVPDLAMARELVGLSQYRLGRWRQATVELEAHRALTESAEHLAVLADCYRALRKYAQVKVVWEELKAASPSAAVIAEGRIVYASSLADQGDLRGALKELASAETMPRRIRDHHVRLWYVLGDLYDRSGDSTRARQFFQRVEDAIPGYVDVRDRIAGLGR